MVTLMRELGQLRLTRRVTIYFTLFSSLMLAAMFAGMVVALAWHEDDKNEERLRLISQRSLASCKMDLIRHEGKHVQELAERLQRENDLLYCAVVSADGRFFAHSDATLVGQEAIEPDVSYAENNGFTVVTYRAPDDTKIREVRSEIDTNVFVGELRVGDRLPGLMQTLFSADGAIIALLGPLPFVGLGILAIRRTIKPVSEVETQLVAAARSAVGEPELQSIPLRSAVALGWNRIVEHVESTGNDFNDQFRDLIENHESRFWESVFDVLPHGVAVTDSDGKIIECNRSFRAVTGTLLAEPETEEADLCDFLPSDAVAELLKASPGRSEMTEVEVRDRAFRLERSRQFVQASNETLFVWTVRDITQQKLTQKVHSQFVDAATHELRTPLANIKAYAETLVLADEVDVEQQKEFCNIISTEATRLARFIDDLLDVRSLEVGSLTLDRQNVELQRLFEEVVDKVKPLMENKQIEFAISRPERLPEVSIDKDKVFGLLVNLLGNAAKYTPEKGQVTLEIIVSESQLEVAVRDTGIGIAESELPKVFDKFFRSEDARVRNEVGTGLGLAIAKEIAELHDGSLSVTSQVDKGSIFTLRIPI